MRQVSFPFLSYHSINLGRFPYYEDNPAFYAEHLKNYHFFKVSGCDAILGYILNSVVAKLQWPEFWAIDAANRTVTLVTGPNATPEERSELMAQTLTESVRRGEFEILKGWRNEMYPVYAPNGDFLLEMERCASPLFGIVTYGVHISCYTDDGNGPLRLWVPRRARTKQTYPGMLDNTVAGGMSTGEKPFECVVRESMEEASLPEDVVRANAVPTGCITYFYVRDPRAGGELGLLQPEIEYVYDIKLDPSIIPKPFDFEVEDFCLLTVDEIKVALANGEFKPNCALVLIDFFIRHGILTPENEPDYLEIMARLHRRLEFPTASHCPK